jgi:hypothetical protein
MIDIRRDLARNTLAILCIIGLIGLSLWVLRPFLAATVWAAMLVVATWPLFRSLELRLGGRRGRPWQSCPWPCCFCWYSPCGWPSTPFSSIPDNWRQPASRWQRMDCRSRRLGWAGCR